MAIALRYAATSDVGLVRSSNQDSAYAGPHLLVIADGMGGAAGGDVASSLAIGELAPLDDESHASDDALDRLSAAIRSAHRELLDRVAAEPRLSGLGTTVTAILRTGSRLALAHLGDSRAYVLRDGDLVQITRDHTFVQSLVDDGRLTAEEAEQHPQRSVLMRVLSDVVDDVTPDLSMREARLGDRYLLCSDGLSGVVSAETLRATLAAGDLPLPTADQLVQLALRAGAPDNVTCIVADVVDAGAPSDDSGDAIPTVVGAASSRAPARSVATDTTSAAVRAAALTSARPVTDPQADPQAHPSAEASHDAVVDDVHHLVQSLPRQRRWVRRGLAATALAAVLVGGGYGAWRWSQDQYFVADASGAVAIYQGLPEDVGPMNLSRVVEVASDVPVTDLPSYAREQVQRGIVADSRTNAHTIVSSLREQAEACRAARATPTTSPSPSATSSPGAATPSGTPSAASPAAPPTGGPATAGQPSTVSALPGASPASPIGSSGEPSVAGGTTTAPEAPSTLTTAPAVPDVTSPPPVDCGGLGN